MIHSSTTGIDEATEEFLKASAGLWEVLESVLNSVSFSFGNTPHRPYGEQPDDDSADDAGEAPVLEANEQWDSGEQSPPPVDSLRLDWYGTVPQTISEALNLTFLPKMDELIRQWTECCTKIGDAISELTSAVREIEACCKPAADAPTKEISPQGDRIKEITERGPRETLNEIKELYGLYKRFLRQALGLAGLTGNLAALWLAMETAHLDEVLRRYRAKPSELKDWSAERREGLEEMTGRYPEGDDADAIVDPFFDHAWLEWQRALRKLIENIESIETSPDAERLRDESLRVLPDILEDLERSMELFQERRDGREAPFDRELLDRANELLHREPPVPSEPMPEPEEENGPDLLSRRYGRSRGHASDHEDDDLLPAAGSYSAHDDKARRDDERAKERFDRALDVMESVMARLREPVRLEVRVLDDRVTARRLDGNHSVSVDLSRGYRMVGYIPV